MRRARVASAPVALVIAVLLSLLVPVGIASGDAVIATSSPSTTGSAVTKTATVTRENIVGATSSQPGTEQVVDSRTVSLSVSQTADLQGRQEIRVSWTGAHPTGGIVGDQNSILAQQEEYPMVLLECRGVDSTTAPASQQLSPQTCWTAGASERYQDSYAKFPPYRLDQFAAPADRTQVVGAPSPLPSQCRGEPATTQFWVPFVAADGISYFGGPGGGCAGQPPEADNIGGSALPSNETFGVTALDGTGSTNFDVWTSAQNASLGCSTSVACSLVAVPIMGISCDPTGSLVPIADRPPVAQQAASTAACEAGGNFAPGQLVNPAGQESLTVSGSLWWSASNWRNRITVPLSFAIPPSACATTGAKNALEIYGSELMIQATAQWDPYFCVNASLFPVVHVQTGEPEARNLISTGSADAAFTSEPQPGGYGKPVVNAPVAVSGFSITYDIDGTNGQPYTNLKLTPLLLAKLLTESYPSVLQVQQQFPALAHNPLNITDDPEFIALNPGVAHGVNASQAASELVSLSSNSDVMTALTSYITADPAARAWLNGTPDKWGMVVNPAYKGIQLPVSRWPLLSTFKLATTQNDCLLHDPVPFLPLVSAPMATLEEISLALQFSIANSTTICSQVDGTSAGEKLVALGRQVPGFRFLIGVSPLADTQRSLVQSAALETSTGTFVTPSAASLQRAASLLTPDPAHGTWSFPYSSILSDPANSAAYPGTMVVYAAVPTSGLSPTIAGQLSTYLKFVTSSGQSEGLGLGQLPPGYLPLTASSGLGALAAYSQSAIADIAAQNGQVPPLVTVSGTPVPSSSPSFNSVFATSFGSGFSSFVTPGISGKSLNSAFFPAVISVVGSTLRLHLGTSGTAVVAAILVTLVLSMVAGATIVRGRRRGTW